MNSTLQILAHTPPLRQYFLSGRYKRDINVDNPLGTGGELAREFALLIREMWLVVGEGYRFDNFDSSSSHYEWQHLGE